MSKKNILSGFKFYNVFNTKVNSYSTPVWYYIFIKFNYFIKLKNKAGGQSWSVFFFRLTLIFRLDWSFVAKLIS